MTSKLSGYIMPKGFYGISSIFHAFGMTTNISVPVGHVIMTAMKKRVRLRPFMNVFLYVPHANGSMILVWSASESYRFPSTVYDTRLLIVRYCNNACWNMRCFQLFFSFHPKYQAPTELSYRLFNCSVEYYSRFQHHLDCNLKTECEDGRDETEHCSYSSPDCQGLVAFCGHCYEFVNEETVHALARNITDDRLVLDMGKQYCKSKGGVLSGPKCSSVWHETVNQLTTPYIYVYDYIHTGWTSHNKECLSMYRNSVMSADKTVLHQFKQVKFHWMFDQIKQNHTACVVSIDKEGSKELVKVRCDKWSVDLKSFVCEFNTGTTKDRLPSSQTTPLLTPSFLLHTNQQVMMTCPAGHVTHTFLFCGSDRYDHVCGQDDTHLSKFPRRLSASQGVTDCLSPLFRCGEHAVSYTLVCNIIPDCGDHSDESFCQHPPCVNMFTCSSGQCVSYDVVCDLIFHCHDKSDEHSDCTEYRVRRATRTIRLSSPVLVNFDCVSTFYPTRMAFNESCPDSHYRCPGEYSNCLPVYTRCNGMYDCVGHEDEEGCEGMVCPGFLRCRKSKICVHADHLCDGWPHCLLYDDEMSCEICPADCQCQGHTFVCIQPFSVSLFPQLRYLDATGSGLNLFSVSNHVYLIHLILAHCSIHILPDMKLFNLQSLDLSGNKLQNVSMTPFVHLQNLRTLSLSNNPLLSLQPDASTVPRQTVMTSIDLSHTTLTVFHSQYLAKFVHLHKLNLTHTAIHTISPKGFHFTPHLTHLFLVGSPVKTFPRDVFKALPHLDSIATDNYKLCCKEILPSNFDDRFCHTHKDEISSCEDLLRSGIYRVFLWLISCLSVTGNIFCFVVRLWSLKTTSFSGFGVFVTNLTTADFLMGVYIAVIGTADVVYRGRYLYNDTAWKSSVACKVAGFLSLLSSEASALIIWLITLDRFIVLRFPFSSLRFERRSAKVACLLTWLIGWLLALLPLLPVTSHWEFYSQTGICVPLPITRREFKGRAYSFSVLIILNFLLFLLISAGQAVIYWSIQKNTLTTNTTKVSRDMTIARRLISVAVTDFMCWFPIGLCGLLASAGVPIPGEVNTALAIFVLPLNSALNPFVYTFNTLVEKRRKANEDNLFKWLESHADLLEFKHNPFSTCTERIRPRTCT